jgi:hypothetical protein
VKVAHATDLDIAPAREVESHLIAAPSGADEPQDDPFVGAQDALGAKRRGADGRGNRTDDERSA